MMYSHVGDIDYDPPEVLNLLPYDYKLDIWSLGCILFFMLFGKSPFTNHSKKEDMLENINKLCTP
jgi:serine/threonine protein kinase